MLRRIIFAALALALVTEGLAWACTGADPAVVSVVVSNVTTNGNVNQYTVTGHVTNVGSQKQASNVLQFVDIYQNHARLDSKSIPPLAQGQSYAFTYQYSRSSDAGNNTTHLLFRIRMRQPASTPSSANCDTNNDTATLTL